MLEEGAQTLLIPGVKFRFP